MFGAAHLKARFESQGALSADDSQPKRTCCLNDRHADKQLDVFDELTKGLTISGYDIAPSLRYPFFADCLGSNNYAHYSRLHYVTVPAGWDYELQAAEVVFAQEGSAEREHRLTRPLLDFVCATGLSGGTLKLASISRRRRVRISVETILKERGRAISPELDDIDRAGAQLMKAFGLNRKFQPWFRMHVALSLNRYRRAHDMLGLARPRARVAVVNSEYHPTSRALLIAARTLGIPTVLVQHGFLGQEWLHWPVLSDRVCVWGDVDKDWYVERGLPEDRISVTGMHSAFSLDSSFRNRIRREQGIQESQLVVVFFAPNLDKYYQANAAEFLAAAKAKFNLPSRWFVRPHPSQAKSESISEYKDLDLIGASVPLKEVLALADVVLHDYSTMAFAQFAGLKTVCVELDRPYPRSYRALLGGQTVVTSPEELCDRICSVVPGYEPTSGRTPSMIAGGESALNHIGRTILEAASKTT